MNVESTMKHTDGRIKVQLKTNWVRGLLILGIGTGGTMAVCLGAFDVVAKNPVQGFDLLRAWGPWAIVVGFVIFTGWKVSEKAIGVVSVGMSAWVQTADRGAVAQERTADALTKLAEQGGRNTEEVRRLAIYAAQEFPSVYARFDAQDQVLRANHDAILSVGQAVEKMAKRMEETHRAGRDEG